MSSEVQRLAVRQKGTAVSEEHVASIFRTQRTATVTEPWAWNSAPLTTFFLHLSLCQREKICGSTASRYKRHFSSPQCRSRIWDSPWLLYMHCPWYLHGILLNSAQGRLSFMFTGLVAHVAFMALAQCDTVATFLTFQIILHSAFFLRSRDRTSWQISL
jgi:hypothetical protein